MAYSSTNPPHLVAGSFGGNGRRTYAYKSADSIATVSSAGYFSNGYTLGMRVGDALEAMQLSTGSTFMGFAYGCVNAVSSTALTATVTFAATTT